MSNKGVQRLIFFLLFISASATSVFDFRFEPSNELLIVLTVCFHCIICF